MADKKESSATHVLERHGVTLPAGVKRTGGGNVIFAPMLAEVRETVEKEVHSNPSVVEEWFSLGSYGNGGAASAAANSLRKQFGDRAEVRGWTFKPLRTDENTTVLFVRYNPGAVKRGAEEEWAKRQADNKAKFADRAAKIQATKQANKARAESDKARTSGGATAGSRGMGRA